MKLIVSHLIPLGGERHKKSRQVWETVGYSVFFLLTLNSSLGDSQFKGHCGRGGPGISRRRRHEKEAESKAVQAEEVVNGKAKRREERKARAEAAVSAAQVQTHPVATPASAKGRGPLDDNC